MKLNGGINGISVSELKQLFRKDNIEISTEEAELIIDFLNNYILLVIKESFEIE